ncbi:MAG: thiamine pyrophosphate-dependent dehydrogenase E1 component subunit alpha [Chthoniobacter sp.]|nr:thiamine pyrophosphate-dependent dehydrogenase E1 component subunit alpha [Chthoniobacter sp.]
MVQATAVSTVSADTSDLKARFLAAYRWMLLARVTEEKIAALYRGGKITGGVFLGKGQEALSTATGMALHKGDVFAPLIRDQAGRLAFGETLLDCTRTYMGSRLGPMRGRDGNVHRGRPREGILAMISHLGAMLPVVVGSLLARRFRGIEGTVGAVSLGDGATSTGAFHEGLNMAAVEKLPLVLVVANNQYAYSTPTSRQFACEDLVDKAVGYGVAGHSVDGTNLEACLTVLQRAVAAARAGGGPQLVVASLLRLVGHGEHDDASYVDPKLRKSPLGADCLELAEKRLLKEQWSSASSLREMQEDIQREVEDAVATTMREPLPDPNTEDWCPLASRHLSDGNQ